jgi:uncharacterized repeat protein (TIGR03803 family)
MTQVLGAASISLETGWTRAYVLFLLCIAAAVVLPAQTTVARPYIVIHNFSGGDGNGPESGLVRDSAGNLYGATNSGGAFNYGTVFKLDTSGHETVLHSFTASEGDGQYPFAGLIIDPAGNLYGTTSDGGSTGLGTVFRIDASGHEAVLHSFGSSGVDCNGALYVDGRHPDGKLLRDSAGNLYGTTGAGGIFAYGTVFEFSPSCGETVLGDFNYANGEAPGDTTGLADSSGNLYGTTSSGGAFGYGTVFEFMPSPLGYGGTTTAIYSFKGGNDGASPIAGLIADSAGNLFGSTKAGGVFGQGTVFEVNTFGFINAAVLHSFTGGDDGAWPLGLIMDSEGNLYGAAHTGGILGFGNIFRLDPSGNETVLHSFTGSDGAYPIDLTMDSLGNLYGTAYQGGAFGGGIVFALTRSSLSGIKTTASGLSYSRVSQTFNGTVTIDNISGTAITGALRILFVGLTTGVTLNGSDSFYGTPYLTLPGGLAPGESVTVDVQFKNPSNVTINFTPAIYSGSI